MPLALINTSGRGQVVWTLLLSITTLALFGTSCSLSFGAPGIPKRGLLCRCWASSAHWLFSSPPPPHPAHLELEDNPDLLGKLLSVAGTNFQAVKWGLQAPWQQSLGSTNYKAVGMLSHPCTSRVTSTSLFSCHWCLLITQASPLCPANKCSMLENFRGMVHTQRAGTTINALLPQKKKGKSIWQGPWSVSLTETANNMIVSF